jgi:hypothetical protein
VFRLVLQPQMFWLLVEEELVEPHIMVPVVEAAAGK